MMILEKLENLNSQIGWHIHDYLTTTDLRHGADLARFDMNENEFVMSTALKIAKRIWENLSKKKSTPVNQTYWELYDRNQLVPYIYETPTIEVAFDIWDIVSNYRDEEIAEMFEEIEI